MKKLLNLRDFEISKKELKSANPKMKLMIHLRYPNFMEWVKDKPKVRKQKLNEVLKANYELLKKKIGSKKAKRLGTKNSPRGIILEANYKDIAKLKLPDIVDSIYIEKIKGYASRKPEYETAYFAVKARFIIQVEGQTKGKQSYEDRILLVRASSFDDAERRASLNYKDYADPYLNPFGQLVRWKFEKVIDIFETFIEDVSDLRDVSGVEVFSEIKERKMREEDVWEKLWEDKD